MGYVGRMDLNINRSARGRGAGYARRRARDATRDLYVPACRRAPLRTLNTACLPYATIPLPSPPASPCHHLATHTTLLTLPHHTCSTAHYWRATTTCLLPPFPRHYTLLPRLSTQRACYRITTSASIIWFSGLIAIPITST